MISPPRFTSPSGGGLFGNPGGGLSAGQQGLPSSSTSIGLGPAAGFGAEPTFGSVAGLGSGIGGNPFGSPPPLGVQSNTGGR